jgi:hypothetical protein
MDYSLAILLIRVARFFLVHHIKTGKNISIDLKIYRTDLKYTRLTLNIPDIHTNTNIFHSKAHKNVPEIWYENTSSGNTVGDA